MKKVACIYVRDVPCGNYFIEDVLYIYELLDSNYDRVIISAEGYEFENLEEFKEYKAPISKMSIKAYNGLCESYTSIEIDTWVRIYADSDMPLARGVVDKIADLAKKRVKPFNIKYRYPSFNLYTFILCLIPILSSGMSIYFFAHKKPIVGYLFLGFMWILIFWVYYATTKRKSTIKLIPKHEAPNFFKANFDKIIIGIISAIVTAIVTVIIEKIAK